jgi:hypothetical protein
MEHLLNFALVSPFFLTLAIFIVAIVFAPAVQNEIAPATEHDHEETDHAYSSSPELVAVLASGLGSQRGNRMDEDQYEIETLDEGSLQVRDLTTGVRYTFVMINRKFEDVFSNELDPSDPILRNQARSFAEHEARKRGLID